MVTYAPVPAFAERKRHPRALILIVAVHAAALAAVMAAKMDLPEQFDPTRTIVELIPVPKPPPPKPPEPLEPQQPSNSVIDRPVPLVPVPADPQPAIDVRPAPLPDPGPLIGPAIEPAPQPNLAPRPIVRTGPRFATPQSHLRPPYPSSKIASDEEAALRLKLSIDERGRVIAVEPVGSADPVFFEAARKHLIARWRYKPATEDGRPIASSTVITLRFQLDE